MVDRYISFTRHPVGQRISAFLGLPRPELLDRYQAGEATVNGSVLLGGSGPSSVLDSVIDVLNSVDVKVHRFCATQPQHDSTDHSPANKQVDLKYKVLLFDATGLHCSGQTDELYGFFNASVRDLLPCGRVIILGRPPAFCKDRKMATVQRSLEGFNRSLSKELRRGATSQLVLVEPVQKVTWNPLCVF